MQTTGLIIASAICRGHISSH